MRIRSGTSLSEIARRNRQEIVRAGLSRRDLLRLGLLTPGGYLIAKHGLSSRAARADDEVVSPPTTPFVEPLPLPPVKQPVGALDPAPQVFPLPGEGRTRPHQALGRFPPQKYYEVHQRAALHSFHRDLPLDTIWGFDGLFPGPTYHARYGEPVLVRNFNDLPQDHVGFGVPQVSTHLHNGHTPSESDGFPCDFFPHTIGGSELFYDQHYPNVYAGFSRQFPPDGDIREAQSTLWYHDHRVDFTAPNVYRGLAGFYLLFNEFDSGEESTGFRLPGRFAESGNLHSAREFDVPLIFTDKLFDRDGQLFFDLFDLDGLLGDKFAVNGKIQPFFQVHPRRYRFRLLDGGPSRFYEFFLTDPSDTRRAIPFEHIGNDGNLGVDHITVGGKRISRSARRNSVRLSVAERADIVVDFGPYAGKSIYLENRLEQEDGRGPTDKILPAGRGNLLLRFDVVLPPVADDSLPPPYTFYELPTPSATELANARRRAWRFDRRQGQWAVNNQFFDCDTVRAAIPEGASEIWTLQNSSGGWQHPIHIHFEEFQILDRNGRAPPVGERGRKDVLRLGFNDEARVLIRFRDFVERYPMHCHNTLHEDHAMMVRWDIVPA